MAWRWAGGTPGSPWGNRRAHTAKFRQDHRPEPKPLLQRGEPEELVRRMRILVRAGEAEHQAVDAESLLEQGGDGHRAAEPRHCRRAALLALQHRTGRGA